MLKFFELNSIRSRMVSGFLFLTFLILILSLVSLYILDYTSRVAGVHSNISRLEIYTLNLIKSDNDFFDLEVLNEVISEWAEAISSHAAIVSMHEYNCRLDTCCRKAVKTTTVSALN